MGLKVVLTDERYTTKRSYCCTTNVAVPVAEPAVEPPAIEVVVPPLGGGVVVPAVQPAANPVHINFHRGHYDMNAKKNKRKKESRGLSHCRSCKNTFDRDVAAAHNIRKLFWYQNMNRTFNNCLKNSVHFIPWAVD